jgi:alpha-tubulin suppressor-like RCC1 family protein
MMMRLSEKLPERTSTIGRLFVVLMATLAVAVALSMVFAGDAEAKKKKNKKPRKPPATYLPAPSDCNQPSAYSGEIVAKAWGGNWSGQLGDGTSGTDANSNTPVQVQNLGGLRDIAGGGGHSLALKTDCTVFAWGYNGQGQLGDGTSGTDRTTPVQVQNLSGVKAIAAGQNHSLALKEDGTVFAWGHNLYGQAGDGTSGTDRTTPVQVQNLSGVKAIAAGGSHSLALKTDGTVFAWGHNAFGQLGNGTFGGDTPNPTPVPVKGEFPTLQPADSSSSNFQVPPIQRPNLSGVKAISAGSGHSLALMEDGTVRSWGANVFGQLGDGTTTYRNMPVQVSGLSGVKAIDAHTSHNLALKDDGTVLNTGTVWAWGWNMHGQLGDGTTTDSNTPVQVKNLRDVKAIDAGLSHGLAIVEPLPVFTQQ